ncbi:MAG: glycosyltransferase [Rhodocyclaceae bacterium]
MTEFSTTTRMTHRPSPRPGLTLCLIIDEGYAIGARALMRSLHFHHDIADVPLVVLSATPLSAAACQSILRVHGNTRFMLADSALYGDCRFTAHRQWKLTPALRYELFRLAVPGQLLYLDVDILITGDITPLLDFRGALGACRMPPNEGMEIKAIGGFNSGILSLDKTHRNPQTWARIVDLAQAQPWSGNQTVINLFFGQHYADIGMEFNMPSSHVTEANIASTRAIHYVGKKKPWDEDAQFGEHQLRIAGPEMCERLLQMWRHFSDDAVSGVQA